MMTTTRATASTAPGPLSRLRRATNALTDRALCLLVWMLRRKKRLLFLAWVAVLFQLGSASMAHGDDLFTGPISEADMGDEATPFERYDTGNYAFLYAPDSNNDGLAGTFDAGLAAITDALFYLGASIVRGALIAMQWMLGLDLYADNSSAINTAVTDISNNLMIPLLSLTLVIAGFTAYARFRRDGGESLINEVAWVGAGAIIATAFALIPGTFISLADGARATVGQLVMKTYSAATTNDGENALGVPNGGDTVNAQVCDQAYISACEDIYATNASRHLANGLWNAWVNTPWCVAQFRHLETCAKEDTTLPATEGNSQYAGMSHAGVILDPDARAALETHLSDELSDISDGDTYASWGGNDRWIRGMLGARLGIVLIFFLVSIPMALFILGLTLFGLMAAVGLLLLVLVGPFFLALWVIPGAPRRAGLQWLHGILTVLLQSVLITLTLGAVAITTAIINAQMGTYGYFISGLLNIVVLVVAWKMRSTLEGFNAAGGSGPLGMTSSGAISSYTAWKMLGGAGRMARRGGGAGRQAAGRLGGAVDQASGGSGYGPGRSGPARRPHVSRPLPKLTSSSASSTGQLDSLPPRPLGRAGSSAALGLPMSAGEYRRENRTQARESRHAQRREQRQETVRHATQAVRPSPDSRLGQNLAARAELRAAKPGTMTYAEHRKNEKSSPQAYQRRPLRKQQLPSMKDAPAPRRTSPPRSTPAPPPSRPSRPIRPVQENRRFRRRDK